MKVAVRSSARLTDLLANTPQKAVSKARKPRQPAKPKAPKVEKIEVFESTFNGIRMDGGFDPTGQIEVWYADDTETTGLRPFHGDRPYAVGLCDEQGRWLTFEFPVDPFTRRVKYETHPEWVEEIDYWMSHPTAKKVFHNSPFDVRHHELMGTTVNVGTIDRPLLDDTLMMARVCNNLEREYGLKPLAHQYGGFARDDEKDLKEATKKARARAKKLGYMIAEDNAADYWLIRHFEPDNNLCQTYLVGDVQRTALLYMLYKGIMDEDPAYAKTYREEIELWFTTYQMMGRGMRISKERTQAELTAAITKTAKHKANVQRLSAGRVENPGSPLQLVKYMFEDRNAGGLGLTAERFTDKGNPGTDWKALRPHASNEFVRELMAYRAADKSIGTFFQKYMDLMLPDDISPGEYCLHPGINQAGALTGRLSCADPNLMQVANSNTNARGTDPIQARAPFGPRRGYTWFPADFEQQELRIFADVAEITPLLKAIQEGRDPNTENANMIWGGRNNPAAITAAIYALEFEQDEPTKHEVATAWQELGWDPSKRTGTGVSTLQMDLADRWLAAYDYKIVAAEKSLEKTGTRGRCKIVTFSNMYGGGVDAIIDLTYTDYKTAKGWQDDFHRTYPEVRAYSKRESIASGRRGYLVTRYGRKLRIEPGYEYRCVNYMVQGTAADMMKTAMRRCAAYLKKTGLDAHVLMSIHDELIFEIRNEHTYPWLLRKLCQIMQDTGGRMRVPMEVEMKMVREQWDRKDKIDLRGMEPICLN